MKLTFTIYRTNDNKFKVIVFKEDALSFAIKHIEVVDTLEEAIALAKDRKHYKNRLSDGFETDEDRREFWRRTEYDRALLECYVDHNKEIQYALYESHVNRKELSLLMKCQAEMEGENK